MQTILTRFSAAPHFLTGIVALLAVMPSNAIADGAVVVRVQDGQVWARFDSTPGVDAINAIKRATAIDVVVPAISMRQTLTLSADAMPVAQFVRRVLENFDVGGFALVYNAGGSVERIFVAEKGHEVPPSAHVSSPELETTSSRTDLPRPSVPFLIRSSEAASIKLGAPGQVIVVQSRPVGITRTTECTGQAGDYPVQTVLVTDATNTYITAIIVCTPSALTVGERLVPAPSASTAPAGDQSRFVGSR